jgi:hypothetical protein
MSCRDLEVDPLKHVLRPVEACPACGGTMRIIALLDHVRQPEVVEKILRHCGLWREAKPRAPPAMPRVAPKARELTYDFGFFDRECA